MSERTRLDEIVEEAEAMLKRESFMTPHLALMFAVASGFRYGVEQSHNNWNLDPENPKEPHLTPSQVKP